MIYCQVLQQFILMKSLVLLVHRAAHGAIEMICWFGLFCFFLWVSVAFWFVFWLNGEMV